MIYDYKRLAIDLLASIAGYNAQAVAPSGPSINVFNGLTEPATFDGIWFKTENPIINSYVENYMNFQYTSWSVVGDLSPYGGDYLICSVVYENDRLVYPVNTSVTILISYDLATGVSTSLGAAPAYAQDIWPSALMVKGFLYLGDYNTVNIYDFSTGTWTSFETHELDQYIYFYRSGAVLAGETIYVLGSAPAPYQVGKIDVTTHVWSVNATELTHLLEAPAVLYGDNIYAMCSGMVNEGEKGYSVIYNITTQTQKWLKEPAPIQTGQNSIFLMGHYIYIVGVYADWTHKGTVQQYDIINDSWTLLDDIPDPGWDSGVVTVGNVVYALGGYGDTGANIAVRKMQFTIPTYPEDSVVILTGPTTADNAYNTVNLFTNVKASILNAWIYHSGVLTECEVYIGTGTQWIPFKN